MKLDKGCALFFGTKIDSKLREGLALSKPGDKKYFDGSSDEFLRIMELGEEKDRERWIGKVIKPGPAVTEVDDIQRNILSILLQGTSPAASQVIDDEPGDGHEEAGESGPYITY
jgi:hypothetical protein